MTTRIEAAKVQVADIQQAFDLTLSHLGDDPITEQKAIELVQKVLEDVKYEKAAHTPVFAKAHQKKKDAGGSQAATPATASATANAIFAAVQALHPGRGAQSDPEAAAPAAPAPATNDGAGAHEDAPAAPADNSQPAVSLTPAEIDKIANANTQVKNAIGMAFANASGRKFQKSDALVKAFAKIETYVRNAAVATKLATAKLELHLAGKHDEAGQIEIPQLDSFTPTGLSSLKFDAQDTVAVNAIMTMVTNNDKFTLEAALTALQNAEAEATKAAKGYREILAKIRKAAPKAKIAGSAEDGLPPYDIVMKMASEIFKDKTFSLPGDLLEFEVPTFEWHGDVPPEVPEIDPTFRFQGEIVANALDAIAENKIAWLYGESGCGKSEFWQQIAARLRMPFIRVNLDTGIVRSDLIGRTALKPGSQGMPTTEFVEGILVRALKMPCILLLDEFDCGDPEIMPVLQPVLEGRGVRILEDGGRLVNPNPWCRISITANTKGLGSENGAYLNVNEQSAATRNRIAKWMRMPYLPESEEVKVVMERLPGADINFVKKLVQLAGKARNAYSMAEIGQIVSTRNVVEAARQHTKFLPLLKDPQQTQDWVLQTTVLESCDDKSANVLKSLITQIFA